MKRLPVPSLRRGSLSGSTLANLVRFAASQGEGLRRRFWEQSQRL